MDKSIKNSMYRYCIEQYKNRYIICSYQAGYIFPYYLANYDNRINSYTNSIDNALSFETEKQAVNVLNKLYGGNKK